MEKRFEDSVDVLLSKITKEVTADEALKLTEAVNNLVNASFTINQLSLNRD